MAAEPDLLSYLADIIEPERVIPWQPALGHWLLLVLAILALMLGCGVAYRRWQADRPRRIALAELKQINWQEPTSVATLNQLLKRLLQSYHPQHPLLSSATHLWQHYLQSLLPATMPLPDLASLLYQDPCTSSAQTREQWWQACAYIITHFNSKTGAKRVALPAATAPLAEKTHA